MKWGWILVVACGAGCAAPGGPTVATEDDRRVIAGRDVSEVGRLAFAPLALAEERTVVFSTSSSVIERDGRRIVAAGFRLPDDAGRMTLAVRTPVQRAREGRAIFFPDLIWLGEDFAELGRMPVERFVLRSVAGGDTLTGDTFIDAGPGAARYLLVTERSVTTDERPLVQTTEIGSIPVIVPMPGGVFVWNIPTGSTAPPARLLASPGGTVVLRVDRPRYRRIETPVAPVFETVR